MNNNPAGRNQRTLNGLSKKSQELTTQYLMRVNAKSDAHALPVQSDKANKRTHGTEGYTPRIKQENEATPPANDLFTRGIYRVGDGEQRQVVRPEGLVAFTKPSRGFST